MTFSLSPGSGREGLSHPKFISKFVLTIFTLQENCKCNSNMNILKIMCVNMVNAIRLQINANGK